MLTHPGSIKYSQAKTVDYKNLKMPKVNLFHFNFLGRKAEYPSAYFVKELQGKLKCIKDRFPDVHYLTLCVQASNTHAISIYKDMGFEETAAIKKGFNNEPMSFYAKKIDEDSKVQLPPYIEFKEAMTALRNKDIEAYKDCLEDEKKAG